MPLKCCVTGCTSNYKRKSDVNIDSVNVYRIQSECKGDDEKLQNWLKRIPRQNLTVMSASSTLLHRLLWSMIRQHVQTALYSQFLDVFLN